jgi:hypothetical protein
MALASVTPMSATNTFVRVAVGDVNGDNLADVVTANEQPDNVSVFLGNGMGGLGSGNNFAAGKSPFDLTLADLNADSKIDIATANNGFGPGEGDLTILIGNGSGGFAAPQAYAAGANPNGIALGDFNADGKTDLAVASGTSHTVGIFLNTFVSLPCLAINDVTVTEGNSGTINADFTVSLSAPSAQTVRVNFSVNNVTALPGADFTPSSGRLVFAPGETTKTISVPVNGDLLDEDDETVNVVLASPSHAALADAEGLGTILDNDPMPSLSINDINVTDTGFLLRNFTVTLSAPSGRTITVQFSTADGTAQGSPNGNDYVSTAGALTIPAGQTSANIGVTVTGDDIFEPDENFFMNLANATNATIADAQGQAVIVNDDAVPTLSVDSTFVTEGNVGTQNAVFNVRLSNPTFQSVSFNFATADDTAIAGSDYVAASGLHTLAPGETFSSITVSVSGDTIDEADERFFLDVSNVQNAIAPTGRAAAIIINDDSPPKIAFSFPNINLTEANVTILLGVTRSGSTANAATVDYTTSDTATGNCGVLGSAASHRCDYTTSIGTLRFAPGEFSKTIPISITDDSYAENVETFTVILSNPTGASLGAAPTATVTISDNETTNGPNPIEEAAFFVRQHYVDFLNREPDAGGLAFWTNEITSCFPDPTCREIKRINVSAAFFLSIEFENTGYLVYRMYKTAYGDTTSPNVAILVPIIRLNEFLPDAQRIGLGVRVGIGDWEAQLEANKNAYAREFVVRQRFLTEYPLTMTPAQFVDKLNLNAGGVLSQSERDQLVAELTAAGDVTQGRASVLRKVAEDADLRERERNRAFVLMQYYGYLRRNPDDPQDTDFRGWQFWLNKLNQFNGNFVQAEMVKAFIDSIEYRQRFGP